MFIASHIYHELPLNTQVRAQTLSERGGYGKEIYPKEAQSFVRTLAIKVFNVKYRRSGGGARFRVSHECAPTNAIIYLAPGIGGLRIAASSFAPGACYSPAKYEFDPLLAKFQWRSQGQREVATRSKPP